MVAGVNTHRLLSHSRLIGISGRLVMVGIRNDTGTHAEDHGRVNFRVRVVVMTFVL